MDIKGRDFIRLTDLDGRELGDLIDLSLDLKSEGRPRRDLEEKVLAMLFAKTSTRTRVSFEAAMFQLGGHYWAQFYPTLLETLLKNQGKDGCWRADAGRGDLFGNAYATSLAVLTLTTPYQLLPIFQR